MADTDEKKGHAAEDAGAGDKRKRDDDDAGGGGAEAAAPEEKKPKEDVELDAAAVMKQLKVRGEEPFTLIPWPRARVVLRVDAKQLHFATPRDAHHTPILTYLFLLTCPSSILLYALHHRSDRNCEVFRISFGTWPTWTTCDQCCHAPSPSSNTCSHLTHTTSLNSIIQFYFSDSNLPRDKFLKGLVSKSDEGWVDFATIAQFKRMLELCPSGVRVASPSAFALDGVLT